MLPAARPTNAELVRILSKGYRRPECRRIRAEVVRARGNSAESKYPRRHDAEPLLVDDHYPLNEGEAFLRVARSTKTISAAVTGPPTTGSARHDIGMGVPHGDQPVIALENKWYRAGPTASPRSTAERNAP